MHSIHCIAQRFRERIADAIGAMRTSSHWRLGAVYAALSSAVLCNSLDRASAAEQSRGTVVTSPKADTQAPRLWVLSLGVSKYKDSKLNLRYADKDAQAVADVLQEQKRRGYYRDVQKKVLVNDQVTRDSIFDSIQNFLGQANSPTDIVVIFMAGHGVQLDGRYYFLPYPAARGSVKAQGLAMSDINDAITNLRGNVKSVVVMLDTCEAGALNPGARAINTADPTKEIAKDEGVFLLAAAKPGEESQEGSTWGHGAFTWSVLNGLRGKADLDGDGWLYVNDLFNYVADNVPELTKGNQHPFQNMSGTRLLFAAMRDQRLRLPPVSPATPNDTTPIVAQSNAIIVLPFEDLSSKESERQAHEFYGRAIQNEFMARLTNTGVFDVRFPDAVSVSDQNLLPGLRAQGIGKLIKGQFVVSGDKIRMTAFIVDTASGSHAGVGTVEGLNKDEIFFELQTKLIENTLPKLVENALPKLEGDSVAHVSDLPAMEEAVRKGRNNDVSSLELLMKAEGAVSDAPPQEEAKPTPGPAQPQTRLWQWLGDERRWLARFWVAPASAQDAQAEIQEFLEEYKRAYTQKDLDSLAKLYVSFPPNQIEALRAYLNNADDLSVELADVSVAAENDTATVSYTRRDQFTEKATGKKISLEVRLKKTFVRRDGHWKFAGG